MEVTKTKVVKLLGREVTLFLRDCLKCGEPTWFSLDAMVCDSCCSEFIDIGGLETPSVLRSDVQYEGGIADRTEAMGQPPLRAGRFRDGAKHVQRND